MTATSELGVPAPRSALYYIVGAFSAPRMRVRELMAEPGLKSLAWQLVLISALISVGITFVSSIVQPDVETTFLAAGYATVDKLIWSAIEFVVLVMSFPIAVFLWRFLFGYRDRMEGVWAASAMAACPAIILDPVLEVVNLTTDLDDETPSLIAIFAVYVLVSAVFASLYYSASLAISCLRAATLYLVNMALYVIAAVILIFAIVFLPFFWSGQVTP